MSAAVAFPEPARRLPRAPAPWPGVAACLSHPDGRQPSSMAFEEAVALPEHVHGRP
ncbi:MAG TPA: hypothetical protein PKM35_00990 [Holophaga sp.]|nr:hypothetical protein [Holophaga sp.]HPS66289.1 hypothetical protein [Holophaga sp.]